MSRFNLPFFSAFRNDFMAAFDIFEYAEFANYPAFLAAGQTIGLIELGGGYHQQDLVTFFDNERNQRAPVNLDNINVVYGNNDPASIETIQRYLNGDLVANGLQASSSVETTGGLEMVMGLAPAARVNLYFCKDLTGNPDIIQMLDSIIATLQFIADHPNDRPDILACSWAFSEQPYEQAIWDRFSQIDALLAVIKETTTLLFAAGNLGSTNADEIRDPQLSVAYPASSHHVVACGGAGRHMAEGGTLEVWNEHVPWGQRTYHLAGTGGVTALSDSIPAWQRSVNVAEITGKPGRGVPDITAFAATNSGLNLFIGNTEVVSTGTSAATPILGTLFAVCYEGLGRSLVFANPYLYDPEMAAAIDHITRGNNVISPHVKPHYSALPKRWDACTGLGFPINGVLFLETLKRLIDTPAAD